MKNDFELARGFIDEKLKKKTKTENRNTDIR